jgi:hypothetical protein
MTISRLGERQRIHLVNLNLIHCTVDMSEGGTAELSFFDILRPRQMLEQHEIYPALLLLGYQEEKKKNSIGN